MNVFKLLISVILLAGISSNAFARCTDSGMELQILGSGGPFGSGSASAGYIVWIDGVSKIMVDAGGGTFARFREAEANIADLDLLALSHFHPDHSAEVPALLWPQNGALRISGPTGNSGFPSLEEYLEGLFGVDGVYRIINPRFEFETVMVNVANSTASDVLRNGTLLVTGVGVPHGNVPALAYRVTVGEDSIVFSSDQNGTDPNFVNFARDADILVVHFAGSENGTGIGAQLHAKPSVWGQIATAANVGNLLLSHISAGQDFAANLNILRSNYSGRLTIGEDLLCIDP